MTVEQGTAVELTLVVLVITRLIVLSLGLLITYYSVQAYRRTDLPYMRTTAIGFAVITLGVFLEGFLFEFLGLDLAIVHIVESVAIAIGFLILLFALRQ